MPARVNYSHKRPTAKVSEKILNRYIRTNVSNDKKAKLHTVPYLAN